MESADESEFLKNFWLLFCNFLLAIIFFCGIAANFLVLLIFYRKPGLRTTANRFVIHLMIINIISCVTLLPITLAGNSNESMSNNFLCRAERFCSIFCSSAIVYSVLLIAIDQYFAVINPLHYHCIVSSWKAYLMIIASWTLSFGLAISGAIQPDFEIYRTGIGSRIRNKGNPFPKNTIDVSAAKSSPSFYGVAFGITHAVAAFLIPFGLICFIYYSICVAASGNSKRARTSILNADDNPQFPVGKSQSEPNDSGIRDADKSKEEIENVNGMENGDVGNEPEDDVSGGFSKNDGCDLKMQPCVVVTRASPPKPCSPQAIESGFEGDEPSMDVSKGSNSTGPELEPTPEAKDECETPCLKPTLKNNSSLSKLSSLRIQFSNSTEKMADRSPTERRHSNVLLATVDSEFENISKTRSSSMQSSFFEISSRSSICTRSTATAATTASTHIQSSRSSSLNSANPRLPPSRGSSIKSTSSCIVHNIRHRISNASLFRYREEARAARISAMVIVMALFCWLPFFAMASIRSGSDNFPELPRRYLDAFSTVSLLASTFVSPFLFAFRNRKVKREMRKIFHFCPDLKLSDSSKSFYARNFSLTLKSQTVQLLSEPEKNDSEKRDVKITS